MRKIFAWVVVAVVMSFMSVATAYWEGTIGINSEAEATRIGPFLERGMAYHERKNFQAAIDELSKALAICPEYADVYILRGLSYYNLGQYQNTLLDAERTLQIAANCGAKYPQENVAYKIKGDALAMLQRYEEAVQAYNKAMELGLNTPAIYYMRGQCYNELERYPQAIRDLAIFVSNPADAPAQEVGKAYALLAIMYTDKIRQLDKALQYATKSLSYLEKEDEKAAMYVVRAKIYLDLFEPDKARKDCERALESGYLPQDMVEDCKKIMAGAGR